MSMAMLNLETLKQKATEMLKAANSKQEFVQLCKQTFGHALLLDSDVATMAPYPDDQWSQWEDGRSARLIVAHPGGNRMINVSI